MSLFDTLRGLLPGSEWGNPDGETFEYRCRYCDHKFESTEPHVIDASCPNCGSDDVRVREDPYL